MIGCGAAQDSNQLTASGITAVGAAAAFGVDGNHVTCLGSSAGQLAAFGTTYAGAQAGQFAQGSSNVAVGYQALMASGAGNTQNVALGSQAGLVFAGANAVMIGYQAGMSLTGPADAVLIGYQAGQSLTAGGNVMIGTSVGASQTTATGCVVVGNGSFNCNMGAGSHNLVIGNQSLNIGGGAAVTAETDYNLILAHSTAELDLCRCPLQLQPGRRSWEPQCRDDERDPQYRHWYPQSPGRD